MRACACVCLFLSVCFMAKKLYSDKKIIKLSSSNGTYIMDGIKLHIKTLVVVRAHHCQHLN